MKTDKDNKAFQPKMTEREIILVNKENKVADESKKLVGRKAKVLNK